MRSHLVGPALLAATLLLAPSAHAKDLRNRAGLGFNNQLGTYPALSFRYGLPMPDPVINAQVELLAGFNTDGDDLTVDGACAGARLLYGIVAEDNMNAYAAAGVGWVSANDTGNLRLQPGLGVQFFLFGLENLGFSAEWGLSFDLGTDARAASFTSAPGAGLHYYF